jgi:hypothetical protein
VINKKIKKVRICIKLILVSIFYMILTIIYLPSQNCPLSILGLDL